MWMNRVNSFPSRAVSGARVSLPDAAGSRIAAAQVTPRCVAATPPLVHTDDHAVRCVLYEERAA